ncbi:MAG: hypothetical protein IPJ65_12485 [Archangiaceae bacterium]|nr:hypothetical protein [Archangiaceae bacterium]
MISAPEVRAELPGIVLGSSLKGLLAGVIIGLIARRLTSPVTSLAVGVAVAAVITFPIAYLNVVHYGSASYYWKLMLPGAVVGAIVGYTVVRYGRAPAPRSRPT